MPDKSCVTMEQKICIACGNKEDTGAILLDTRLRDRFDRTTVTGWFLCTEHQKMYDDGYIILVGIDPNKSGGSYANKTPSAVYRTGVLAFMKEEACKHVFDVETRVEGKMIPCMWVSPEVMDKLIAMQEPDGATED